MKTDRYTPLRLDPQLYDLVQKSEGKNTSAKIRNLLVRALGVELTYRELEGQDDGL